MTMTTMRTTKHLRSPQGEGNTPWPPRCVQCRELQAGSALLSRRSGGGGSSNSRRPRPTLAYYIIAALTAAATLSMGPGKSSSSGGSNPMAIVVAAAMPFHHASTSTRRGNIGSVATLFLTTEVMLAAGTVSHPVSMASADASVTAAVPPTLLAKGTHDELKNGVATFAYEGEFNKFMSTRFLQFVEDSDAHVEDDHDDHVDHDDHIVEDEQNQQHEEENYLPWGQVIGATFLVSLATLSGLIIIAAGSAYRGILKLRGKNNNATGTGTSPNDAAVRSSDEHVLRDICIFAFAAGALVATAVFLVIPEALHLIEGEY